jgi:alpha-beta hydrolase superfamily lysophospholipase
MRSTTFTLEAPDGAARFVYSWLPDGPPKAALQIAHGLAEHAGRYARLAAALTAAGYAVYAGDHRGHGRSAAGPADLGFFAEHHGWRKCVDDLSQLHRRIAADHAGLPILFIGHSMGASLAQYFISERGDELAGAVLSGSGGKPPALATIGRVVARIERWRLGARGHSALIHSLTFGAFNKQFAPARTAFDWLSRDAAEVDRYVADPLCGFAATVQLWVDMLDALADIASPARLARIPKRLPLHVICGSRDPVGDNTKAVAKLLDACRAAGLERVTHRFYPDCRHELFNELNRDEVTRDLVTWLDGVVRR